MIETVLIANRGEIACRVIRTLRELGITSVAVYSDADAQAPHVKLADRAVHIGPAAAVDSYLRIDKIVAAAQATGADAVHPGYGFLSENVEFARALDAAGIVFLGPPVAAIDTMGDKIAARAAVVERDVPVVPGISRPGLTDAELIAAAEDIGYPVLIKPSAGGGGKGMHRVENAGDLPTALQTARREAGAAFGDDTLFLERFVDTPRHIEVQVLADTHGNVVHLGERECSLQRRHQKVIEEAPSALLDAETRARIGTAACDAARSVGYTGVGTVEFIVSAHRPDEFFFMEMNTRLQVEHPVTELVTGHDLVRWQIRVADGEKLDFAQDDVVMTGHAVEARVYAEDPASGFLPTGGELLRVDEPSGTGVRVDSGMADGVVIGSDYDPMLAKVICYAPDRATALDRLDEALAQTRVLGLGTNIDFCRYVLARPEVRSGELDTELLDRLVGDYAEPEPTPAALLAVALRRATPAVSDDPWQNSIGWRVGQRAPVISRLQWRDRLHVISVSPDTGRTTITVDDDEVWSGTAVLDGDRLTVDGVSDTWAVLGADHMWWVSGPEGTWKLTLARTLRRRRDAQAHNDLTSPMPGTVVAVHVESGAAVEPGQPVVVVEAMKMEHTLTAAVAGTVTVSVRAGEKVRSGQVLASVEAAEAPTEPTLEEKVDA
ncbi:acetyl/propionyl/methylcrotonyl-CoA carboxylase subunit alpha [Jongsikchunia kroppenstedtii]|uniref:acetyl/propionyl/methylcrotonyl-CoA carboxylase subunit alpha n=1 Tax=Jongsikchunia kroppenstedtii TaxID=1121721 RepID=UPI0003616AA5|nr:biotin carboxylase N-terminal domain-containing protein [Jongsikchunia kroppenstedtii]